MRTKTCAQFGYAGALCALLAAACTGGEGADADSSDESGTDDSPGGSGTDESGSDESSSGGTGTGGLSSSGGASPGTGGDGGLGGLGGWGGEDGGFVDPIENGSFETGDYAGWTIVEEGNSQVYAVEEEGFDLLSGGAEAEIYDQYGEFSVPAAAICSDIPGDSVQVSDGTYAALWLQAGESGVHSIQQRLVVPEAAPILAWDMAYLNSTGSFSPSQNLSLQILSADGEDVLETPFLTETQPTEVLELTTYEVDLSDYAGEEVRISFVATVVDGCFAVNLDHFRFVED